MKFSQKQMEEKAKEVLGARLLGTELSIGMFTLILGQKDKRSLQIPCSAETFNAWIKKIKDSKKT